MTMATLAARWTLAAAVAKYQEGSRILRKYALALDPQTKTRLEGARADLKKVIKATSVILFKETRA